MSTPTVQSIDRAFEILEALGNKPEGMLVKELSAQLGLNKSTVSRILATLAEHGYVEKNKNNYYRIGMRMVDLCSLYLNNLQLKTEALPFLEELRAQTGMIVHLGTMDEGEVVYLEKLVLSATSVCIHKLANARICTQQDWVKQCFLV